MPADWPHHLGGFAAHWNKNSNLAWAFDVWFLNLFPREQPFVFNGGGYATLSFIPTLGTMILGLLAGRRPAQRPRRPRRACAGWSWRALAGVAAGWLLGRARASARWSSGSGRRASPSGAAACAC